MNTITTRADSSAVRVTNRSVTGYGGTYDVADGNVLNITPATSFVGAQTVVASLPNTPHPQHSAPILPNICPGQEKALLCLLQYDIVKM